MKEIYSKNGLGKEPDIVFSKTVVAGKRIYYIDVKRNKKSELFITITESKKILSEQDPQSVYYEKHKVFLYKEDFEKFLSALEETITYAKENNMPDVIPNQKEGNGENHSDGNEDNPIRLKIDF